MNKDVKKQNQVKKDKFIETRVRSDNSKEVIIKKSPMETTWGKILLGVILVGFVLLPVASLIWLIIEAVSR
ncbi:MAG TPA: hypothetical protein PLR26_05455 [Bacilli bacterium]|nr:hypothetical protein [Bacilli bacterium]